MVVVLVVRGFLKLGVLWMYWLRNLYVSGIRKHMNAIGCVRLAVVALYNVSQLVCAHQGKTQMSRICEALKACPIWKHSRLVLKASHTNSRRDLG